MRDQHFETLNQGGRQAGRWCFDSAGPVRPRETTGNPLLIKCAALAQTVLTIKGPGEKGPGCPFFILEVPG